MAHIDDVLDSNNDKPTPAPEKKLREITPEPSLTLVEVTHTNTRLQQLKELFSRLPN